MTSDETPDVSDVSPEASCVWSDRRRTGGRLVESLAAEKACEPAQKRNDLAACALHCVETEDLGGRPRARCAEEQFQLGIFADSAPEFAGANPFAPLECTRERIQVLVADCGADGLYQRAFIQKEPPGIFDGNSMAPNAERNANSLVKERRKVLWTEIGHPRRVPQTQSSGMIRVGIFRNHPKPWMVECRHLMGTRDILVSPPVARPVSTEVLALSRLAG